MGHMQFYVYYYVWLDVREQQVRRDVMSDIGTYHNYSANITQEMFEVSERSNMKS
jgi:hypothetical protein